MATTHVRTVTSREDADAYLELVNLSNEASRLSAQGDLRGAERIYRDVLARKPAAGFDDLSIALTQNELGVVLRQLGEYDEALALLQTALGVRAQHDQDANITIALCDSNITRDEIAKVYEALGDCETALLVREDGKRICGNGECQALEYKDNTLHACSRCKCVFYCGKECQRADWRRHKKHCRAPAGAMY